MKPARLIEVYRADLTAEPPAVLDAQILAAARVRRESRPALRFAAGLAAALIAVFILRWLTPGTVSTPEHEATHYGISEGQSRAWLVTFDPALTSHAYSHQEGTP